MIAPAAPASALASLPRTARSHFRLRFYGAVAALRDELPDGVTDAFPFLGPYFDELAAAGALWHEAPAQWEHAQPEQGRRDLPILRLKEAAALDESALLLLFAVGLVEEDARFGAVFEALHGAAGRRRPTFGLLAGWLGGDGGEARTALRRLLDLGLAGVVDPSVPRSEHELDVAPALWDALRGEPSERPAPWARYRAPDQLARLDDLILAPETRADAAALPQLVRDGAVAAIVVRGPRSGGRRTVAAAIARELRLGLLEVDAADPGAASAPIGPLATLLGALPAFVGDPPPGETLALPELHAFEGAVAVVIGRHGAVAGPAVDRAVTLALDVPAEEERRAHWAAVLPGADAATVAALAAHRRMTGGNIRRVAPVALAEAALAGDARGASHHVRRAGRAMHGRDLETMAHRLAPVGGFGELAVPEQTAEELLLLLSRCRNRERLPSRLQGESAGVRALFTGPSGTGKTLAARVLAAELGLDVYRLDLSTVVNKYLGETEKNLAAVFARAEELDVLLLLDEGDALLTRRTDVNTSNDRYANLETNYLLQRLETFDGILFVTTNAGDRIDSAFRRRMDVVVEFPAPDTGERLTIWELHLAPGHDVSPALLHEVASRCMLTGGAIRNAALHAALLAVEDGGRVVDAQLEAAVRREYRKLGAICPLRSRSRA
jgi:ATPase family associated with various cellular activities (AAA)